MTSPAPSSSAKPLRSGLILSGGGARAAYQVGALLGVNEILNHPKTNPFPVICGTSAGAINAAALACYSEDFSSAVEHLNLIWGRFHADMVYRADPWGIAVTGAKWLSSLAFGWLSESAPKSLLDNSPLAELLERLIPLGQIQRALDLGFLQSLCVTASNYDSGESVSFYQSKIPLAPWTRVNRVARPCSIGIPHLLASSAIPFIFPAAQIDSAHYGDGSMRQLSPISPAIHLGAERLLIIGAGRRSEPNAPREQAEYPSIAQVAGHALSSIFLDSLNVDIERAERINHTLEAVQSLSGKNPLSLKSIKMLVIYPSERLDLIATAHFDSLPWAVKKLLGGIGAKKRKGGALASYLLFEAPYTQALIDLGRKDAMAMKQEVLDFFA